MTEPTAQTPVQQAQAPVQQAPAAPQQPQEDWKPRYDGLVKKTEELVGQIKMYQTELAAKTSEIEQMHGQLSLKDVEKSAAVGERDKSIEKLVLDNQSAQKELERLKALELKIQVANKLGQPELIRLADTIPNMTDPDAMETVMKNIADYTATAVKAREAQLLAGAGVTAGGGSAPAPGPGSRDEWLRAINNSTLGTKDRQKLIDDYGDWLAETNNPRR